MLHFDTGRAYKHFIFSISVSSRHRGRIRMNLQLPANNKMVIIVAVREMDFEAVE